MAEIASEGAVERSFAELSDEALAEADRSGLFEGRHWSKPLSWGDLLKSDRILIVSQAGSGKTYECQKCQRKLWEQGEPAFFIELAELARTGLADLLRPDHFRRFEQWRASQASIATFFLDSFDELKLTQGSFRTALTNLARAIDGQLARSRFVITSRPIPVDRRLVAEILPVPERPVLQPTGWDFADIAMNLAKEHKPVDRVEPLRTVELLPLSNEQIFQFAVIQGVTDAAALVADIRRRNATEFAERPQDLIELCSAWRDHHRIGSHREQVANDIAVKLKPRTDRRERSELSSSRALEGASRLALAAILTRRMTFRYSAASDVTGAPGTALDPADILYDWTPDDHATLLERPLFGFASYGRVRFHHRSVVEYLAAHRLGHYIARGWPISSVKRLLFTETAQRDHIVRPAMRPVAAWLSLESESIFADACKRDPSVLLDFGDPDALSDSKKGIALSAYVDRYGSGGWRGLHIPGLQVRRFASSGLAATIQRVWPRTENPEVRALLLDFIAAAKVSKCADIAFQVVLCPTEGRDVRLSALDALVEIGDPRLEAVVLSLELDVAAWPSEIARGAVVRLFPGPLGEERLILILTRLTEAEKSVGYLTYYLPRRIADMSVEAARISVLRRGLYDLVREGVVWTPDWSQYKSARQFLVAALAASCARELSNRPITAELADSITLALRLAPEGYGVDEHVRVLRDCVAAADANSREILFWAEDTFRQSLHSESDPGRRLFWSTHYGPVKLTAEQDGDWIRAALRDTRRPQADRAMLLHAALHEMSHGQVGWRDHVLRIRDDVADSPELAAMVDLHLMPITTNTQLQVEEARWEMRRRSEEQRAANDHASWIQFWQEVADNPDVVFAPDRAGATAWNLWTAMSRSGRQSRASGWDRPFLEMYFNKTVADRLRDSLRTVWRNDRPTLRSERNPGERDTFLVRWQLGLAAIAAEAEDPHWAKQLTSEEARLACRYAPIELNGFPRWLDSLAQAHPTDVDSVLGAELSRELLETAELRSGGWLLRNVSYSSESLARLFAPRIRSWLDEHGDKIGDNDIEAAAVERLNNVLDILLRDPDAETVRTLREIAVGRLSVGMDAPVSKVWLRALMKLDPEAGTSALLGGLDRWSPAKNGPAVEWIGSLFGDRHSQQSISVADPRFTPKLLLNLVRAFYRHVRVADDVHHEGAYSPNSRDHAEHARGVLLGAILDAKGPEGWAAKLELAEEPAFAHMRDRVLAIARERAAQEADGAPMDPEMVVALERRGEAPPRTRDDMFQIIQDRFDDIDDLLRQDVSPREAWAAITDERVMRRALSRELKSAANRAYTVVQEGVTGEEKETDIRLQSTVSDQQGVIELKLGDKRYSAQDLRDSLSEQLVRKYMTTDECRAGCLVITIAKRRRWIHPKTGKALDLDGLVAMLNEDARHIVDGLGGALRVAARGLDLRPRLLTERAAGSARSDKR